MAFAVASGSFYMPAMAANAGHRRTPMAIGTGRLSVANSRVPFVCLAITGKKEEIITDNAPPAVGPYSQGIKANNFIFVSGSLGLIPETAELISDSVEDQTEQVFEYQPYSFCFNLYNTVRLNIKYLILIIIFQALKNIGEILKAGGVSFSAAVKTTIMLADIGDFQKVNTIYAKCEYKYLS
ncbi:hypothetical protein RDI58_019050 [Solanum bulbocastanum]|uniref:Uncharacterized protein n=1 Tax=Solanum bulbocastanum TaxID=147425 RepID=A0AAN8TEB5_SOLBU